MIQYFSLGTKLALRYFITCVALWCVMGSVIGQSLATPFPYDVPKIKETDTAMVVSAHPLATAVGVEVLRKGGNAVDAAIAVQFALAVVYPQAGNIGGGGFLVYRSKSGVLDAIDYRERAPRAAYEKMYQDSAGNVIANKSRFGAAAAGVPGTVDGMWRLHKKYGTRPWSELVQPSVLLARKGFRVTEQEARNLNQERMSFVRYSRLAPAFVKFTDWKIGDTLVQPDLANTLDWVATGGRDGFYKGAVAKAIVAEMSYTNGLIDEQDLANYESAWRKPLVFEWKGMQVVTMPPPSSGGLLLRQMLGMIEPYNLGPADFQTVASTHLQTEIERRAYADRAKHMGDADYWPVPVANLTDAAYIKGRMADFDPAHATPSANVKAGAFGVSEETTHYSIVDGKGNAVSVTTTLNDSYGCRTVVSGAGFILNNEMDDFSVKPGVPNIYGAIGGRANAILANKRPLSSMTPTILSKDGQLSMVVGTPGGTTIPNSVFQTILNYYVYQQPLLQAVHAKRTHHQWIPDVLFVERGGLSEDTLMALKNMGHTITERGPMGRVEAIVRLPNGRLQGVADNRGDDAAGGY